MKKKLKLCAVLIVVPLSLPTSVNAMLPISGAFVRLHTVHPSQVPHGQKYNYRAGQPRLNGYHHNAEIVGDLLTAVSEEDNKECCEILFRSGLLSNKGEILSYPLNIDYSANMRRAADNSSFGTQKVWRKDRTNTYVLDLSEAEEAGISISVERYGPDCGEIFVGTEERLVSFKFKTKYYRNPEPTVNREANKPVFFFHVGF